MWGQTAVEVALAILAIFSTACGFVMRSIQSDMKELRDKLSAQAYKTGEIEVLVASTYVKREEMLQAISGINAKLDRIIEQIANKADR